MPGTRHFILATAGHVDHGKSALIKALTGTDPDRLPEEQARGITIDLGFAHLDLKDPADAASRIVLGIVDVPGHEDFVKNMVAGVGSIDLALLVVAADDGWMPQTEEHLQILSHLGVRRAVVALTKIDLAQDEQATTAAIRERLAGTPFAAAPIVPTSVVTGRGLEDLKSALARVLADAPAPADIGKPRLPVDRVFKLQGIGTVVTGTLSGGVLRRGQNVSIQPAGRSARVRNIQSHGRDVESSSPGTRTALNLSLDAVEDIHRGDVVTLAEFGGPSDVLDVLIEISPRATSTVRDGVRVHAHHGSGTVAARVAFCDDITLNPGERSVAQLRLESPAFVFAGDRLILRDWSERATLGGGLVLDPDGNRKAFRSEPRMKLLATRAASPEDVTAFVASQVIYDGAARASQLLQRSRFGAAAISSAVAQLLASGAMVAAGDFLVDATLWRSLRSRAIETVDARHRAHPEESGLPLNDLRAALQEELPAGEVFEPLVADLCTSDRVPRCAARRTAPRSRPSCKPPARKSAHYWPPSRSIHLREKTSRRMRPHSKPCAT